MVRLSSIGHREHLAAELASPRHRRAVRPGRVAIAVPAECAHSVGRGEPIQWVEKRLLAHRAVSPRGTARLRRLLADWNGLLRRRGSGDLCSELRAVLAAL